MSDPITILGVPTDVIRTLANVATACAAALAARFAWLGLQGWRTEMLGKRKAELAEDVLADFYRVRDLFKWVRSLGSLGSEAENRPREEGEGEDLALELDSYFAPISRLHKDQAFLAGFHAKRYRFKAVFGQGTEEPFQELRTIEAQIITSANMLSRLARSNAQRGARTARELRPERLQEEVARREQHERRIWDAGEADDPINVQLDSIVERVEALCRPAIEARAQ